MKKWAFLPLFAIVLCGCASGSQNSTPQQLQVFAMDTQMDLTVYGDNAASQAALLDASAELHRLDTLLSRHNETSALSALNQGAGTAVTVDSEVYALLKTAAGYTTATDGAFDISIAPIMDAWDFLGEDPRVPSQEELEQLSSHVGSDRIVFDDAAHTVTLEEGMAVDLGAIAKGYASDRLAAILAADGVDSAMVNLGGNVYVHGSKPDGSPWRVGISDPLDHVHNKLGVLSLTDSFVITSGGYQRNFTKDGVTYYHIIDPKTGDVARSGLLSATVVCDSGTMGDALSTSLFVMGLDRATAFWKGSSLPFEMILVDTDDHVYLTEGLKDCFDSSISEHTYEYIYLTKT